MGNLLCMGLILQFESIPSPGGLDGANHRLSSGVNVDVLDRDLLLALAAIALQRLKLHRV